MQAVRRAKGQRQAGRGYTKQPRQRVANFQALSGIDLDVAEGEIFGFLGPNGAGKSTTVRMLTTLMTITAGTARVAGVDCAVADGLTDEELEARLYRPPQEQPAAGRRSRRGQNRHR